MSPLPPQADKLPDLAVSGKPTAVPIGRRVLVGLLLTTSFACNVAALELPFMHLRMGLAQEPFSLFYSVGILWNAHLQVLAVLVVAFSMVFPFIKLAVLGWLCAANAIDARRATWLGLVDRLGKWSMLDVFIVSLILTLVSGQLLVRARPLIGLSVFATAIILSMAAGEVLSAALPHADSPKPVSHGAFRLGGLWVVLSGFALVGTLLFPLLQIHDWFVADKAYSFVTLVPTLFGSGAFVPAAAAGAFLIVMPLLTWIVSCAWWLRLRANRPANAAYRLMHLGRRWSMLDVFGLALAVFAVEGSALIKTEVRWGALFLAALVGIQLALQTALVRAFARE